MIESQALDLDHVGIRRDHYFDLADHFAQAEQLAKDCHDDQGDHDASDENTRIANLLEGAKVDSEDRYLIKKVAGMLRSYKTAPVTDMDKVALDCGRTAEAIKRLLLRELDYVQERQLDAETRNLYAINLEGGRGTPLKEPYVSREI